ncbi:MAG: hypothetical protein UT81_C0021G0008 [Parcubacteria group bacterium GW2011_GWA2_40_14]|nr:MAG: hypothetical protein UT81_C0021G0008 [Parcubacteria group bacterium GW2011_GWA2_40_14]
MAICEEVLTRKRQDYSQGSIINFIEEFFLNRVTEGGVVSRNNILLTGEGEVLCVYHITSSSLLL